MRCLPAAIRGEGGGTVLAEAGALCFWGHCPQDAVCERGAGRPLDSCKHGCVQVHLDGSETTPRARWDFSIYSKKHQPGLWDARLEGGGGGKEQMRLFPH